LPLTVHTSGVLELNVTGRLEVAVAERVSGPAGNVWLAGPVKSMVCEAAVTVKLWLTDGAGA